MIDKVEKGKYWSKGEVILNETGITYKNPVLYWEEET